MINLNKHWYQGKPSYFSLILSPLSWLFGGLCAARRWCYQVGLLKSEYFPVPIVICGNLTVGGTGKTPLVIWLTHLLKSHGYSPGIVSRGSGGAVHYQPCEVDSYDSPDVVGDEALLLKETGCPVVIGVDRVAVVKALLKKHTYCDVIICDDGLQHYRLGRQIEIAVVDGLRHFGNQKLLPAGPLREPVSRLETVDFVVINEGKEQDEVSMELKPRYFVSLANPGKILPTKPFTDTKVHAVAGIGHPERFFASLRKIGFDIMEHPFPDHHLFQAEDFNFLDNFPIIMTEKDAVKCKEFADDRFWYMAVTINITSAFEQEILSRLNGASAC